MAVLGNERHKLVADKTCLSGAGFRHRYPTIDGGARDFQLDALTKDGNDVRVFRWFSAEIHVDRGDDSGPGAKWSRRADHWGASDLCDLRRGRFGLCHWNLCRNWLSRNRRVVAFQAARQEHSDQSAIVLCLQPSDTGISRLTALLEANREFVAVSTRVDWAADIAACDRGCRIGVVDANVDRVLGSKEIGERRVDDRRTELRRNCGERALRGFTSFVTFDGAYVDELEGRLGAKSTAAAGVDPGRQWLAWLDEPADAREGDGLRHGDGRGPWRVATGCRLAYQLPSRSARGGLCRSARGRLAGSTATVQADLAGGAVRSTIAAGAPDGWLNWNRTTVEGLGDARGNPNGGKHGQPAQDAAPAGALGAGRYRYRERIEPAGVHALLLPQLRCNLALALVAPR
jgi:hypothetical protein